MNEEYRVLSHIHRIFDSEEDKMNATISVDISLVAVIDGCSSL